MKQSRIELCISTQELSTVIELISKGLKKYIWIQSSLHSCDPSADPDFQRRYGGFYRVRRNEAWRSKYFKLFKDVRDSGATFAEVLNRLNVLTGRVEASFSSKLYATVYPDNPVIDSVVLQNLGLSLPRYYDQDRLAKICALHAQMREMYEEYLSTKQGQRLVRDFEKRYPESGIRPMKILDFVLWQSGTR